MDWSGSLVQKEMKFNYFFSEKADGLEEGKYGTAGWFAGGNSSVWSYGGRGKGFLQFRCVLESGNWGMYVMILYMHTFLLYTFKHPSQKVHTAFVSGFWYAIISIQIYGLGKKVL